MAMVPSRGPRARGAFGQDRRRTRVTRNDANTRSYGTGQQHRVANPFVGGRGIFGAAQGYGCMGSLWAAGGIVGHRAPACDTGAVHRSVTCPLKRAVRRGNALEALSRSPPTAVAWAPGSCMSSSAVPRLRIVREGRHSTASRRLSAPPPPPVMYENGRTPQEGG